MFKRLFGAVFAIVEMVGLGAVIGYGLEAGKDTYNKHKQQANEKSKGRK